jgi:WD40 repeat protein
LEHPYIVPLYAYWREPGSAYLVMRLMRGGSLQAKLKDDPLDLDTTLRLLQQIGNALHSAHRAGVIHRDIKPANILLDGDDNAYLADFGFAKNLGQANLAGQTQAGTIIGSLEYISPEQIQADRVKPQSDIYCLGIMFYEMLTGHKPFQGVTPVDYIKQHLKEPLPPLSAHYSGPAADQGLLATLDAVLARATAKSPSERYPDVIAMLVDVQETLSLRAATAIAIRRPVGQAGQPSVVSFQLEVESPYKGLQAFGEADAADFFGRETVIQTLLGRMAGSSDPATHPTVVGQELDRFLAVVGPSGSGKSSVVRAGLIPALRRGGLPGSENWFIVKMIPGTHPWEELEAALLRVAVNPPESLLSQLREDERGLLRAVRRILPADETTELVLVIDQFEEIFTLCADESSRAHLLDSLVMAVLDPRSRLRVVMTLRADFTDRPLQYVDFGELVRHRTEFVLPLTPDEMEGAIAGPARRVGLTLEPGLPETIIGDLGDQPGTLPLLQYTLTELFERRVGNALTLGAYQASGGVRRVLAGRADKLYTELDDVGQEAVRQLFLHLITLGEVSGDGLSAPDTRRRVLRAELTSLDERRTAIGAGAREETNGSSDVRPSPPVIRPSSMMDNVIDKYGRHRLLTFDRDPVTRGPTVEVAHEALIREWGRLRRWLAEDREFLLWQQRLRAALHQWAASEQDEGALLRGAPLAEAENWFNQREADLSEAERNFIQASLDLRERRAAEREVRRQRELEAAQKLAETEKARAEAEGRRAEAEGRRAEAESRRAEEQARAAGKLRQRALFLLGALLVAGLLAAVAVIFGQRASQNEQKALTQEAIAVAEANDRATAQANAFAEAEQRATAQANAETQQKEAERQAQIAFSRELAAAAISSLDIDPERGVLLALQALSEAHTLEAENALHQALPTMHIIHTLTGHTAGVMDVAYSLDGKYLATAADDGKAILWEVKPDGIQELFTVSHAASIRGVTFSPDGKRFATGSEDGTAKIWDVATGQALLTLIEQESLAMGYFKGAIQVDFSPDGKLIATANLDGVPKVWDATTGEELLALLGHTDLVTEIVFSPDGKLLATSGLDNTAKLWNATTGEELFTLSGHTYWVEKLAFSPDGTVLVTAGNDDTAKVWDVATGEELFALIGHEGWVDAVAFSPDGKRLATSSYDGTAKIWDATNGQELLTLTGHQSTVLAVAFSPDGRQLATGSYDGTAKIWDTAPGQELLTLTNPDQIMDVTYSQDGTLLASAGEEKVRVRDVASGETVLVLPDESLRDSLFRSVTFSPNGAYLAAGDTAGTIFVWNTDTGEELLILNGHTNWIFDLTFSPDGSRLATSSLDGTAKVWDISTVLDTGLESGQALLTLDGHTDSVWGLAYNPDGTRLATASWDDTLTVLMELAW